MAQKSHSFSYVFLVVALVVSYATAGAIERSSAEEVPQVKLTLSFKLQVFISSLLIYRESKRFLLFTRSADARFLSELRLITTTQQFHLCH